MNSLQERILDFTVLVDQVVDPFYEKLRNDNILSQIKRSSTSVGANYSEAQAASSKKDFHNKVRIALKEARESEYWLRFLQKRFEESNLQPVIDENLSIIKILTTIARKTDPNPERRNKT